MRAFACAWTTERCWTAIVIDSNAYWATLPTGLWQRLLARRDCKVWMPAMASNVTEAQSHDECTCRGGRSVTGVHGSVTGIQNRSVTCSMEKMNGHRNVTEAWFHGLLECMLYFWEWGCNYKVKLNVQPVHEWVMAIYYIIL